MRPSCWSFRNKEWVRIGTRDILGREPIRQVTRELADVAEAIVTQVARDQWKRRAERYGSPVRPDDLRDSRWAILGLGKLGRTRAELPQRSRPGLPPRGGWKNTRRSSEPIANEQFVTEVAQRVLKALERQHRDRSALSC